MTKRELQMLICKPTGYHNDFTDPKYTWRLSEYSSNVSSDEELCDGDIYRREATFSAAGTSSYIFDIDDEMACPWDDYPWVVMRYRINRNDCEIVMKFIEDTDYDEVFGWWVIKNPSTEWTIAAVRYVDLTGKATPNQTYIDRIHFGISNPKFAGKYILEIDFILFTADNPGTDKAPFYTDTDLEDIFDIPSYRGGLNDRTDFLQVVVDNTDGKHREDFKYRDEAYLWVKKDGWWERIFGGYIDDIDPESKKYGDDFLTIDMLGWSALLFDRRIAATYSNQDVDDVAKDILDLADEQEALGFTTHGIKDVQKQVKVLKLDYGDTVLRKLTEMVEDEDLRLSFHVEGNKDCSLYPAGKRFLRTAGWLEDTFEKGWTGPVTDPWSTDGDIVSLNSGWIERKSDSYISVETTYYRYLAVRFRMNPEWDNLPMRVRHYGSIQTEDNSWYTYQEPVVIKNLDWTIKIYDLWEIIWGSNKVIKSVLLGAYGKVQYDWVALFPAGGIPHLREMFTEYSERDFECEIEPILAYDMETLTSDGKLKNFARLGRSHHGILHGDPQIVDDGKIGRALEFDGSGDYVEIQYDWRNPCLNIRDKFSFFVWFKAPNTQNNQKLASKFVTPYQWVLGIVNGKTYTELWTTGGSYSENNYTLTPNEWHHYGISYDTDDSHYKVWVDGAVAGQITTDGNPLPDSPSSNVLLGSLDGPSWQYTGVIDEVRYYSKVLSQAEVQAEMKKSVHFKEKVQHKVGTISVNAVEAKINEEKGWIFLHAENYDHNEPVSILHPHIYKSYVFPNRFDTIFFIHNRREETDSTVVYDDDETFWSAYQTGTGSYGITLSEETTEKVRGSSSLKMVVASGSYDHVGCEHDYGLGSEQNWSSEEFICVWLYGANTSTTKYLDIYTGTPYSNWRRWNIIDNYTGWRRHVLPLKNPNASGGTPDMSAVRIIRLWWDPTTTETSYLDRTVVDVGNWVKLEILVPDVLLSEAEHERAIHLYSWDVAAGNWHSDTDHLLKYDPYDATDYAYAGANCDFLDGTAANLVYGADWFMEWYPIGERGESVDSGSPAGGPNEIWYSLYHGTLKRIGLAFKMPPSTEWPSGLYNTTGGMNKVKLKLKVHYSRPDIDLVYNEDESFWSTWTSGTGLYGVSIEADETEEKMGASCLKCIVDTALPGSKAEVGFWGTMTAEKYWVDKDYISFWMKGTNSGDTWNFYVGAPDWSNRFSVTVVDNHTSWHNFVIPLSSFSVGAGSPSWAHVKEFYFITHTPVNQTIWVDYLCADVYDKKPFGYTTCYEDLRLFDHINVKAGAFQRDPKKARSMIIVKGDKFTYNMPLDSDEWTEEPAPTIIEEDNHSFWSGSTWGTGTIGTPTISADTTDKVTGTQSTKVVVGSGSAEFWHAFHDYTPGEDWSLFQYVFLWWKGTNSGYTFKFTIQSGSSDWIQFNFVDNYTGWPSVPIVINIRDYDLKSGSMDVEEILSDVTRIGIGSYDTSNVSGTFHFDEVVISAVRYNWAAQYCTLSNDDDSKAGTKCLKAVLETGISQSFERTSSGLIFYDPFNSDPPDPSEYDEGSFGSGSGDSYISGGELINKVNCSNPDYPRSHFIVTKNTKDVDGRVVEAKIKPGYDTTTSMDCDYLRLSNAKYTSQDPDAADQTVKIYGLLNWWAEKLLWRVQEQDKPGDWVTHYETGWGDTRTELVAKVILTDSKIKVYFDNELVVNTDREGDFTDAYIYLQGKTTVNSDRLLKSDNLKIYKGTKIYVEGLAPGWKVEMWSGTYASPGSKVAEAVVPAGGSVAELDVLTVVFPFTGFFKVFDPTPTEDHHSPDYTDIWGGDIYIAQQTTEWEHLIYFPRTKDLAINALELKKIKFWFKHDVAGGGTETARLILATDDENYYYTDFAPVSKWKELFTFDVGWIQNILFEEIGTPSLKNLNWIGFLYPKTSEVSWAKIDELRFEGETEAWGIARDEAKIQDYGLQIEWVPGSYFKTQDDAQLAADYLLALLKEPPLVKGTLTHPWGLPTIKCGETAYVNVPNQNISLEDMVVKELVHTIPPGSLCPSEIRLAGMPHALTDPEKQIQEYILRLQRSDVYAEKVELFTPPIQEALNVADTVESWNYILDDFNDNSLDTDKWDEISAGTGGSIAETNQRIEMTKSSGGGILGLRTDTKFKTRGLLDFYAKVYTSIPSGAAAGGPEYGVLLMSPDQESGDPWNSNDVLMIYITRRTSTPANKVTVLKKVNGTPTTLYDGSWENQPSGELKLRYNPSTKKVTAWRDITSGWVQLYDGTTDLDWNDNYVYIYVDHDTGVTEQVVHIFDDFQVDSEDIS